jgi:hypothetical protein
MAMQLQPEEARLYRLCDEALQYVWDRLVPAVRPRLATNTRRTCLACSSLSRLATGMD